MTMALIPLAGLVGGGIDISRMYIVKTRLQHACDAGALAGRKAMGGGVWTQTVKINNVDVPNYPKVAAEDFFDANFTNNSYGLVAQEKADTRSFTENAGKVSGTASVKLPMTLMQIFGHSTETLSVTCEAEMRLPNTDVMFVLDTTGSMSSKPNNSGCDSACVAAGGSKIQILRVAVKCFYEIVARLDTDATCVAGNPSGGTGTETQIRFGFVPYSMNVNVGKLLPSSYFPDSWHYQTREPFTTTYPTNGTPSQTSTNTTWGNTGSWVSKNYTVTRGSSNASDSYCQGKLPNPNPSVTNGTSTNTQLTSTEYHGYRTVTYKTDTAVTKREYRYNSFTGKVCYFDTRDTLGTQTNNYTRNDTASVNWKYDVLNVDYHTLKSGNGWNDSFIAERKGANGTDQTITWDGCIEERETHKDASSYNPAPADAYDLNIDMVPTGDIATQWKPAFKQLTYLRSVSGSSSTRYQNATRDTAYSTGNYNAPGYSCPTQAKKLQAWPVAKDFDDYVDSLAADGNTYHDIGMIWGARLMSPTGIFASENAFTPKGGEIERHMIYMTDGIAQANPCDYSAYGVAWYDRRTTDTVGTAANCGTESADLDASINTRLSGLCTAVKNKNITLWVITFGAGVNQTTKDRLKNCASSNRYFDAGDAVALQKAFADIANQISALRLTN